jgi:cell division septation protein DedD
MQPPAKRDWRLEMNKLEIRKSGSCRSGTVAGVDSIVVRLASGDNGTLPGCAREPRAQLFATPRATPRAKPRALQRGLGQGWMLMTIGVMVGFVLGFILFLSRLPEERYTLVETERAIEEYKTTEASQFAFYDNLSDVENAVPSVEVDDIQDFKRSRSEGKYGAGSNERAGAVQMAEELSVIDGLADGVNPLSVPAGNAVQVIAKNNLSTAQPSVQPSGKTKTVREPTVVKKIHNKPSTSFYLQAGAFTKSSDAERMKERLTQSGMDAFVRSVAIDGKSWHRVRIGPFYDSDSLYNAQTKLGRNGISYLVIKVQS